MDQGFTSQGFAPSASVAEGAAQATQAARHASSHAAHAVQPAAQQAVNASAAEIAGRTIAAGKQVLQPQVQPALTPEQKKAENLRGAKDALMMPTQLEAGGMLAGFLAGKLGFQRARVALRMAKVPAIALRQTMLGDIFSLPAKIVKVAADEAAEVSGAVKEGKKNYVAGWSGKLSARSEELARTGARFQESFTNQGWLKSLSRNVGNMLDGFAATRVGSSVERGLGRIVNWRKSAAAANHERAIQNVGAALESESNFKWVGNIFSRGKAEEAGMHHLQDIASQIHAVTGDAAKLKGLHQDLLQKMGQDAFKGVAKHRAGQMAKHLGKAAGSALAVEHYGAATNQGLKAMLKSLGKAAGHIPILYALIGAGAVAATGAALVTAKGENKEAKIALADVQAVIGNDDTSGFLNALKHAKNDAMKSHAMKAGLQVMGDVADGAMWANPHSVGGALMAAQMMPMALQSLVPGEPALAAAVALRKADKGELQISKNERVEAIHQLVAVMPSVAKHGGYYNHLAKPIANAMVEQNLNYEQILKLLANNDAFTAFSREVAAKLKKEMPGAAVNDNVVDGQKTLSSAEKAYLAAEKPARPASHKMALGSLSQAGLQVG